MKWKCEICGKEFENFLAYFLHMEWHERQRKTKFFLPMPQEYVWATPKGVRR